MRLSPEQCSTTSTDSSCPTSPGRHGSFLSLRSPMSSSPYRLYAKPHNEDDSMPHKEQTASGAPPATPSTTTQKPNTSDDPKPPEGLSDAPLSSGVLVLLGSGLFVAPHSAVRDVNSSAL